MTVKLTKPQVQALRECADREIQCSPDYPPIRKLVLLGFASERRGKYLSDFYTATDAGRAALAEIDKGDA